ncbi:phage head completion protein [Agrobacterium fabrum]|uniref:phage head completion protein n=1 Tax=Agrobacterium fabrum TaxID=1176649 RepID=UPI003B9EF078
MTGGGDLRRSFAFWQPTDGNDGFGTITPGAGPPALRFTTAGRFRVLSGDEIYLNGVVSGKRTVEVTIRMQPKSKGVNTTWFMRDTRDNRRYNIKLMTPSEKGDFITFRAEEGKP